MSERGDLLELLHRAHRSFDTVRVEAREWRHVRRTQEAYARQLRSAGHGDAHALPADDGAPEDWEVRVRACLERPNRVREERGEADRVTIAVSDGSRWWQVIPEWSTSSDEGDGWATGQVGECLRHAVDPSSLATGLDLEPAGRAGRAGREAILVAANPRPGPYGFQHDVLLGGADRHELAIDAERGFLLEAVSFLDDAPASLFEVLEIAFDEPLDPSLFTYEPAPGEQVAAPHEIRSGDVVTIEAAARTASFAVHVPGSLGHGWRSHVLYTPGREGTRVQETVTVSLYRDDATHSVTLRQTAGPWQSWQTNGTEETQREGRSLRVSVGPWRRVLVEQEGTHVELDSGTVETDALVELALSLVPARTDPPPLVE
jgi:outer membrane lipoprotein-sorting protein